MNAFGIEYMTTEASQITKIAIDLSIMVLGQVEKHLEKNNLK